MNDLTHPNYVVASPGLRYSAAFLNLLAFGAITLAAGAIARLYYPPDGVESAEKLLVFGFGTIFWLVCGLTRSSPGALFCLLRFCHDDRSRIGPGAALARSLPYYAGILLAQYPIIRSVTGAGGYILLFATYLGLLVTNFVMLACSGRPPFDRWLKVTVLVLKLPPEHMPKVMGLRIK